MKRRELIGSAAGGAALSVIPVRTVAQAAPVALSLGARAGGPVIPRDYVGLSYETAQLANPGFFSPANKTLIALFRELSTSGVLRIGGGSSEYASYSDADPVAPPPFEVFDPDTSKTVKHGTLTTALALRQLRGFLDATGWHCIWGLNFGQGSIENAAAEAAAVQRILGPRLMLVQIGNEPDGFRTRYRPAAWGPADFLREWNAFHRAIAAAAPGVKFAGPDISNKLDYLTAFAAEAPDHPDVVMLTGHYYAMGPAESPEATIEQLMSPDPSTTTMHADRVPVVQAAVETAHLPFRMTEGNSCWNGGKAGVSDTLASALWCADAMLRFARYGWIGVNWHGGGNGNYTAISGSPSAGFVRRPEFYGIRFAAMLTGARFVPLAATGFGPLVTAYAAEKRGRRSVAIFNKGPAPVAVTLPKAVKARATILTGPSLDATQGIELRAIGVPARRTVAVPAHSAILYGI